jgi:hypothetical protein
VKKSEKKYRELEIILKKGKVSLISEAIRSLRGEEPFKGAIELLAEHYNITHDRMNISAIEEFFNDIKYLSARSEIMTEIRKPSYKQSTISMLISSCWQSGLDYSEYVQDIVRVFLEGDYSTAIECMTLIEESLRYNTREDKDEAIRRVEKSSKAFTHEKNALSRELISILAR